MDGASSSTYNAQAVVSSIFAQAQSIASDVGGPASSAATSSAIILSSSSAPLAAYSSSAFPRRSSSSYVGVSGSSSYVGVSGSSSSFWGISGRSSSLLSSQSLSHGSAFASAVPGNNGGRKVSPGTIAGAVVGGIAGLAIILGIGIWLYRRSRARKQKEKVLSQFALDDEPRVVPFQPFEEAYGRSATSRVGDPSNSTPPPLREVDYSSEPLSVSAHGRQSAPQRFVANRPSNEKEEPSDIGGLKYQTSRDSTARYSEGSGVPHPSTNQGYNSSAANDTIEDRAVDAGPLKHPGQLPPAYNPEWRSASHRGEE